MLSMVPVALIEAVLSVWRMVVGRPGAKESQRDTPGELGRVSHHPLTAPQSPRGRPTLRAGQLPMVGPLR